MSDKALKPCPFCGAAGVAWRGAEKGNACCPSDELPCGAVFYEIADWNRRPGEDALRTEIARLRAELEAAEAVGFQRAISAAVAIIDARHDKIAEDGTEFSPFHAGMVEALSWASDEVGELATKAKAEGADR